METIIIHARGVVEGDLGPAAVKVQIAEANGNVVHEVTQSIGNATNNFAAYNAVFVGLQAAEELFGKQTRVIHCKVQLNNELVQHQLIATEQIRDVGLIPLFIEIHNLRVAHFPNITFVYCE